MILIYLLKVTACTFVFFAAYQFIMAKLTFFKLNRLYLLSALLFSFVIPALTITSERVVMVQKRALSAKAVYSNQAGFETDLESGNGQNISVINWNEALTSLYLVIFAVLFFRTLFMFVFVKVSIRKNLSRREGKKLLYVRSGSNIKNCSFFNQIIIDESLSAGDMDLVISHESAHVDQKHALDKLLVNFAVCVLWFNPVIYLWRNAIDHNHEFLADQEALKTADRKAYASLLLSLATSAGTFALNSFSKLPLKERIKMLYKTPDGGLKKLLYLAIFPILTLCSMAFINHKEVVVTEDIIDEGNNFTHVEVYKQNYFKTSIVLDPDDKHAFEAEEMVLVLDAGHGGKDDASTALDGQKEKDMNLRAVNILKEEAAKRGIKVRLTRTNDEFLSLRDRLTLQPATAFISIHHNATPKDAPVAFKGIEVYVSKLNTNIKIAEELGSVVLSQLKKNGGISVQDSLKNGNLLLLREAKVPAILIEMGNITNQGSLDFISKEKNIRAISNLILDGFVAFSKRGC